MISKILLAVSLLLGSVCYGQQKQYKAYEEGMALLKNGNEMSDVRWVKSNEKVVFANESIYLYSDKNHVSAYKVSLLKKSNTDDMQRLIFQGVDPNNEKCTITFDRMTDSNKPHQLRIVSGSKVYLYNLTEGS